MNTMTASRVEFDDCAYSDAQELLYEGQPYTGVVTETAPGGRLMTEQSFTRGILDGRSRAWYANGQLSDETVYAFGIPRQAREWHRAGQLRRDVTYDSRGKVVTDDAWDESGRPVKAAG